MIAAAARSIEIVTPEGVRFRIRLAGPMMRFLAWLLDCFVILTAGAAVGSVFQAIAPIDIDVINALHALAGFSVTIGYSITLEWLWRGQTIGKRLLRLKVIDERGLRLTFPQVLMRNLLRAVDFLPLFYVIGGCALVMNRKRQRLGDFAARTIVAWYPEEKSPDLAKNAPGIHNSFRDFPHLAARLRQKCSAELATVALDAVLRRDDFAAEARITLFREIAAKLKPLAEFPEEAIGSISDEQYVRNAVDVLFRE